MDLDLGIVIYKEKGHFSNSLEVIDRSYSAKVFNGNWNRCNVFYDDDDDISIPPRLEDIKKAFSRPDYSYIKTRFANDNVRVGSQKYKEEKQRENISFDITKAFSVGKTSMILDFIIDLCRSIGDFDEVMFLIDLEDPYMKSYELIREVKDKHGTNIDFFNTNNGVEWIYILSPKMYEPLFTKEELLAIPAYKVYEWDNEGRIYIQVYENAWDFEKNPQSIKYLLDTTRYLSKILKEK